MLLVTQPPIGPTAPGERNSAVDVLRGFAVLGILLMNIQSFAMIYAAYLNPKAYGDLQGLNYWSWAACHIFADQKFMTLFSLLFGAGILLMAQRAAAQGRKSGWLHYRRIAVLLLFGLAHAYGLWHSDILVSYALCAVVVYWFRNVRPGWLMFWSVLGVAIPSLIYLAGGSSLHYWPPDAVASLRADWSPALDKIAWELEVYRSGWVGQMAHRLPTAVIFQTFIFAIFTFWRVTGLMLLGMALLKWGVVTAQRSPRFYSSIVFVGCLLGVPLIVGGIMRNSAANWSMEYSMFLGSQYNYWGSLFLAAAYMAAVMLVVRMGVLPKVQLGLASVGRTALTNYLAQSVICTFICYGHGLGLFGKLERWQQVLVVACVWAVQITGSVLWLRHFRYGPAEWLWRSLTYFKWQPMRVQAIVPPAKPDNVPAAVGG